MRKKTEKTVLTFANTHTAIKMEQLCKERGLPGRIIPLPGSISAGCGLCWCILPEERDIVTCGAKEAGIEWEAIHEVML